MKQDNYKPLEQYIQLVDERNRDGAISKLVGVSFEKKIIPSIANTIGTDLSNYRIIKPGQFAYCPVTSRNGERISIALYKGEETAILSVAYSVFEIIKPEELDADYLMLWVSRPEFDRYARFMSHGSVRELFSWEEMCNVLLPVPPISEQRRIVSEYQTVERRIKNNEAMIQKLEETAQAIYHHTFVEGIDENNLPEGWRMGCIGEYCKLKSGFAFQSQEWQEKGYPVIKIGNITSDNQLDMSSCSYIGKESIVVNDNYIANPGDIVIAMTGATIGKSCIIPDGTKNTFINQRVGKFILGNEPKAKMPFLYCILNDSSVFCAILNIGQGSAQANFSSSDIENINIILPPKNIIEEFNKKCLSVLQYSLNLKCETSHLRTLLSLLTSKLS